MYDIGLAIPADAGTIADISKKCFSSPWDEKSVAGDIASDHAIVLSAGTSGRIVGYAICYLGVFPSCPQYIMYLLLRFPVACFA